MAMREPSPINIDDNPKQTASSLDSNVAEKIKSQIDKEELSEIRTKSRRTNLILAAAAVFSEYWVFTETEQELSNGILLISMLLYATASIYSADKEIQKYLQNNFQIDIKEIFLDSAPNIAVIIFFIIQLCR